MDMLEDGHGGVPHPERGDDAQFLAIPGRPDRIKVQHIKFIGVVKSFDPSKGFGLIASNEAHAIWNTDIYAFKSVLESADIQVEDVVRFGVHVNTRGQPQASLPIWKCDHFGEPMHVKDGEIVVKAEELHTEDPTALQRIGDAISLRSQKQNENRATKRARTNSSGPGAGGGLWGGDDAWGGGWDSWDSWGKGGKGGKGKGWGGWPQSVDLFIEGVPPDATSRELHHIFRQYAGFQEMRRVHKGDSYLTFVTFATPAQAEFVASALEGYVFDTDNMQDSARLSLRLSRGKGGKGKK